MGTSETSVRSGSSPSSILTGEGELLERRERKNRILQIFLPCEPNARTGKKQRRCSLCAAAPCARAKQPNYATTLMHGHLALDCEALASSDDWEDRRLLLDLRRTCPSSLVKTDHQKQKGEAAAKPQDRDSQRQGAALSSHLPSISSSASPLAQAGTVSCPSQAA